MSCSIRPTLGFLKAAAHFVPGGTLALHEPILDRPVYFLPHFALWQQTIDLLLMTFPTELGCCRTAP
jgi:hypothetical protein